jgi:hypothetical protein
VFALEEKVEARKVLFFFQRRYVATYTVAVDTRHDDPLCKILEEGPSPRGIPQPSLISSGAHLKIVLHCVVAAEACIAAVIIC